MSKQSKYPKTSILGLEVDKLSTKEAIEAVVELGMKRAKAGYIVRPHVEFIEQAARQPEILKLLNQADFSLVDGVALQWAASHLDSNGTGSRGLLTSLLHIPFNTKRLRSSIPERVAGITFTLSLLEECQAKKAGVYLIGSPQKKSISHTANYLKQQFPKLNVAGSYDGNSVYHSQSHKNALIKELERLRPDVVLVGLGFPRQEQLMAQLSRKLSHGIFVGEGGTFDYKEFGGHIKRAPSFMRRSGLEWLWRLARQPKRIKRQMAIPRFIRRVHLHKKRQ